jgi:hypothetical protein
MKKIVFFVLTMMVSLGASAESILFNGTVASNCSFSGASDGTLSITGTTLVSATSGTIVVTNNDAGVFTLTIGSTALTTSPNSESLSSVTTTGSFNSGDNAGVDISGGSGVLASAGVDSIAVTLSSGVLDSVATAGNYVATSTVTCAA